MATTTTVLESMAKPAVAAAFSRDVAVNDAAEFAEVAARYRPQIFRFLLASLRDPDAAETLTQDCLLKAHRNWTSFRGRVERDDLAFADCDQSAEGSLAQPAPAVLEDEQQLRGCRGCQPVAAERRVLAGDAGGGQRPGSPGLEGGERVERAAAHGFMLRHVEEMEIHEIANTIGLSEGTVKAHLSRAMVRVRAELGGRR
jgi:RNA polymerase sigma-70 factor (ECF subfamily)